MLALDLGFIPFFRQQLAISKMGGSIENPILLDDEEDKEISPPSTPVSERPIRPSALLRSRAFGTRI